MQKPIRCPYCAGALNQKTESCPICGRFLPEDVTKLLTEALAGGQIAAQEASPAPVPTASSVPQRTCPVCGLKFTSKSSCPVCGARLTYSPVRADEMRPKAASQALQGEKVSLSRFEEGKRITHPKTIAELQIYCAQKGMKLDKMRFFIGQDYRGPKAFGIYREGNTFIVYKNKDTGQRAVRYHGPDEAYAVNELFQKLLSECHMRGIYPDRGDAIALTPGQIESSRQSALALRRSKRIKRLVALGLLALFIAFCVWISRVGKGYYRKGGKLYYHSDSVWYVYDGSWSHYYGSIEDDYYLGYSYDPDYGAYSVRDSYIWESDHPARSSSSYGSGRDDDWDSDWDWDSWDSSDTDWGSDW